MMWFTSDFKFLFVEGMLMELDIPTIQTLLDSPTDLQKAVNKAVCSLNTDESRK